MSEDHILVAKQVGRFLEQLCASNQGVDSVFKCISPPPIDLVDYAARLGQYIRTGVDAHTSAAVLLSRLHFQFPTLFCVFSAHKLLAAAIVIAIKFEDDFYYANSFYAECAGVCLQEMNSLETTFLHLLNFSVFIDPKENSLMLSTLGKFVPIIEWEEDLFQAQSAVPPKPAKEIADHDVDMDLSWSCLLNDDLIFD